MIVNFVSIFPNLIQHWFTEGVIHQALKNQRLTFNYFNPRSYSNDKHQRVDDRPFGGGPGMVMQYEPLKAVAETINRDPQPTFHIHLSPQGIPLTANLAEQLAEKPSLTLWCGRYEGIDQRFIDQEINLEVSIGDFIISGGEMAACILADSVCRFAPKVLGDAHSAMEDSFTNTILDHPHYTRPKIAGRIPAPEVLLSGNHSLIAQWRLKQALGNTFLKRPDLFNQLHLNDQQKNLLNEFLAELNYFGEPS